MKHKKKIRAATPSKSINPKRGALLPLGAMMMLGLSIPAHAQDARKAASSEQVLPTVSVQADADLPQDGYRATATRVGKVLQDPHDVPQAVTTVTQSLMEEQQVGSLREALRNVSGLTFNAAEGGRSGDNMMLRGFYTFGDMYLDGIRDTAQYNRETFNLEQIDVLRGSAAMLFGRGQAGGVINQVSKTPLLTDRHKLSASIGTDGYSEASVDLNKRLGATTAARINIMNRDEGSWRSNPATGAEPEVHRQGVAASVGFGLSTVDELTFSHYQFKARDHADYGVPFDSATKKPSANFPAEAYWGIAADFDDSDIGITTATHQHRFSPDTLLRTQIRHANYDRAYWASAPSNTAAPDANGNAPKTRRSETYNLTAQSDFSTKFKAGGFKHELIAGIEYLKEDAVRYSLINQGTATDPFYSADGVGAPITYKGDTYAVYAQDSIELLPHWKLLLGARRDELKAKYSSASSPSLKFGEWSYRSGLSYQPKEDTHYYVSWSDSFSPTADLYQLSGSAYPAERSQVWELGAKWLFFGGDLAFRSALYCADKEWERNTDLESTASILSNKRRTEGLELELAGRISDKWEVFSGLALMDAKILEVAQNRNATTGAVTNANPNFKDQMPANTPRYTFNLWSTYKLGDGWKIGGGVETKGKRYAYNTSNSTVAPFAPNTAPAYVRLDGMLAYEQRKYTLRLNVQNLLDTVYYDAVYVNGGFAVPGTGRRLILSGEFKF